jgi:hypothetical protein
MKIYPPLVFLVATATSCATMNESVQLGATIGTLTGASAAYAGHVGAGSKTTLGDIAIGAGIGTVLGVITSYLVHGSVEEKRASLLSDQTEMHFGDLPPSPFIIPNRYPAKKGVR